MPELVLGKKRSGSVLKGVSALHLLILAICLALFVVCDVLKYENYTGHWVFLSGGNALNILNQVSTNAIIAFGMTLAIVITGIDLSVGSVVALTGVVLCRLLVDHGMGLAPAIGIVLAIGLIIGLVNGFVVAWFRIPAFVATLASMIILRGLALLLVDGVPIFNDNAAFLEIGNGMLFCLVPMPVAVMAVVAAPFMYVTRYSIWGRRIYALGGNEEAATLAGVIIDCNYSKAPKTA